MFNILADVSISLYEKKVIWTHNRLGPLKVSVASC